MSAFTEFEVAPGDEEWQISRDGEPFLTVQTKEVAIEEAVTQARQLRPGRVVVRGRDGSIEDEASIDADGAAVSSGVADESEAEPEPEPSA